MSNTSIINYEPERDYSFYMEQYDSLVNLGIYKIELVTSGISNMPWHMVDSVTIVNDTYSRPYKFYFQGKYKDITFCWEVNFYKIDVFGENHLNIEDFEKMNFISDKTKKIINEAINNFFLEKKEKYEMRVKKIEETFNEKMKDFKWASLNLHYIGKNNE